MTTVSDAERQRQRRARIRHTEPAPDMFWQEQAACRNVSPAVFFDDDLGTARRICAGCPVVGACLNFAIATKEPEGVWGGLTGPERRRLVRQRRRLA